MRVHLLTPVHLFSVVVAAAGAAVAAEMLLLLLLLLLARLPSLSLSAQALTEHKSYPVPLERPS